MQTQTKCQFCDISSESAMFRWIKPSIKKHKQTLYWSVNSNKNKHGTIVRHSHGKFYCFFLNKSRQDNLSPHGSYHIIVFYKKKYINMYGKYVSTKKQVSMTKVCHNHKPQTKTRKGKCVHPRILRN